eukprot:scaffold77161_cov37-Attheya_sp.AAC.2
MTIKRLSSIQREEYTTPGHIGNSEIDNHADTLCLGANCLPVYFTGELCDVAPYSDSYTLKKDVPVAQAATAYTHPDTGEMIIFILNQGLWFGRNFLIHYGTPTRFGIMDIHYVMILMIHIEK